MNPIPTIGRILAAPSGGLQPLYEHSARLQTLTRYLQSSLEPPLQNHIVVANIRQQQAVLATDSPGWASRLRFESARLLALLRQYPGLENLESVQLTIIPGQAAAALLKNHRPTMSPASGRVLQETANVINHDAIRAALIRLSRHGSDQ